MRQPLFFHEREASWGETGPGSESCCREFSTTDDDRRPALDRPKPDAAPLHGVMVTMMYVGVTAFGLTTFGLTVFTLTAYCIWLN